MPQSPISFDALHAMLKAAGETTRLRVLALLAEAELTVSDLTDILRQSQPRISRHLKLLAEAGLVERYREGSWAFFRLADRAARPRSRGRLLVAARSGRSGARARPRAAGRRARGARRGRAGLFPRDHAAEWDRFASCTWPTRRSKRRSVEALGERPFRSLLDLGTGTGRMLELFGPRIERGLGIDLSLEPCWRSPARRLERAGLRHCSVRQADIYDLAAAARQLRRRARSIRCCTFSTTARARSREAARMLRPGGRLLVVDFAPHDLEFLREEHAHRRLGFAAETISQWMTAAGLDVVAHRTLPPDAGSQGKIAVSLWLAHDRRMLVAEPAGAPAHAAGRLPDAPGHQHAREPLRRPHRHGTHPRLVRVLSAQDRGDGKDAVGIDQAAERRSRPASSR